MLKALKKLISGVQNNDSAEGNQSPQDDQLLATAAAMLLLEVAWADHDVSDNEIQLITQSVERLFKLPTDLIDALVKDARKTHEASVGLYEHTRAINDALAPEDKFELMVALWQLALSDETLHALEEHSVAGTHLPHRTNAAVFDATQ